MKFCSQCGKELFDEAVVCMGCGCAVVKNEECLQTNGSMVVKRRSKFKKIWIILGTVALLIGIVAAVLFVPRNLKMDDIKETNVVSAILQYGLPESISSDGDSGTCLEYRSRVDFYGITPDIFRVYPDEGEIEFFFWDNDDASAVYDKIERYCDLEENFLDIKHVFSYGNLEITIFGNYATLVSIEIN